jgi:hypothetical protein
MVFISKLLSHSPPERGRSNDDAIGRNAAAAVDRPLEETPVNRFASAP